MSKAEGESDEVVNDYLDKKFDSTDEFLEKYVALRKVMHMRKAKLDKMGELMKNPDKNRTPARKAPEPPPPAVLLSPASKGHSLTCLLATAARTPSPAPGSAA